MRAINLAVTMVVAVSSIGMAQRQTDDPGAVLDRAVAAHRAMSTALGEFEQTVTNPVLGSSAVAKGEFVRKAPNLISITFTDPEGDRIVNDGKVVWAYLPSTYPGRVIRFAEGAGGLAPEFDPVAQFMNAPRQRFNITGGSAATIAGRATHMVTLTPKKGTKGYSRVTVWVDDADDTVRQFEVVEPTGLTRRVLITKLTRNPEVKSSVFVFTPPKGAKVVDSSTLFEDAMR